jgi:RNA polymerase sigma-70 factor (ECF subfamily)
MNPANFNDGPVDLSALDRKGYESLFHQYYQWLCLQAFKITSDWHAGEDIVQDFFARCWQNRMSVQVRESFAGFALVSVRNSALNYLKKENTRLRHETASSANAGANDAPPQPGQPDETDRRYLAIINAINQLPEQRRKAFILGRQQHMKYADIAIELGISVNTVKMHIRLAYQELRGVLKLLLPFLPFFLKK